MIRIISFGILTLFFHLGLTQNVIPERIDSCRQLRSNVICECLKTLIKDATISELAYSNYYRGIEPCNEQNIDSTKILLINARKYWDKIGYHSFRYLFTFLPLIDYYYENTNLDSVEHYYNNLIGVTLDYHVNSLNNVLQATLRYARTYSAIGDIYKARDILIDFSHDSLYQNYPILDKIWFTISLGEMHTDTREFKDQLSAIQIHQTALSILDTMIIDRMEREFLKNHHLHGIARSNKFLNKFMDAIKIYNNTFDYFVSNKDYRMAAITASEIAQSYIGNKDEYKAIYWLEKSINLHDSTAFSFKYAVEPFVFLSQLDHKAGLYRKSIQTAEKGIQICTNEEYKIGGVKNAAHYKSPVMTTDLLTILSKNYEKMGIMDSAQLVLYDAFEVFNDLTPIQNNHKSKLAYKKTQIDLFEQSIALSKIKEDNQDLFWTIDNNKASILALKNKFNIQNNNTISQELYNRSYYQFYVSQDSIYGITHINEKYTFHHFSKSQLVQLIDEKDYHKLYQTLITPLNIAKGSTITIIPDGKLAHIPFGALLTDPDDPTSFLEKDYIINYQLSATLMQQLEAKEVNTTGLAAFAPSFNDNPNEVYALARGVSMEDTLQLYNLPYIDEEVEYITDTWDAPAYTVTKDNVIDAFQNKRIFHFSGHAVTYNEDSDYSFLALSSDVENLDKKLLLKEIYNLKCNNEMVVLSACETGTGEIAKGEGVLSLARGFFYAGAKSVISTLWSVNDQSSSMIMKEFYRQLRNGKRKDEALREAKLHYLNSVGPEYQDPKYWAGFIAVGDMSPIFTPWWKTWWPYAAIGVLVLVGVLFFYQNNKRILNT